MFYHKCMEEQNMPTTPQNRVSKLMIAGILFAFFITGIGGYLLGAYSNRQNTSPLLTPTQEPTEPVEGACTMDAHMCSDGSAVGRIPPDCQFAPCPSERPIDDILVSPTPSLTQTDQVACTLEVRICPDGSPVGRRPPDCEFDPCPQ